MTKTKISIEELDAYYESLKTALDSGDESIMLNSDRTHNATVMRLMFDRSSVINMYCGELSILREGFKERKGFKEHLINEVADNKGKDVMQNLIDSFKSFIAKDGVEFNVILENSVPELIDNLIDKDSFIKGINSGKIKIYSLGDKISIKKTLPHFVYSDVNIARHEQQREEHQALCTFNDKESIDLYKKSFKVLLSVAQKENFNV